MFVYKRTKIKKDMAFKDRVYIFVILLVVNSSLFLQSSHGANPFLLAHKTQSISNGIGFRSYHLTYLENTYRIGYYITGGKLESLVVETGKPVLTLNILGISNGTLTIQLPRNLTDSKIQGTNTDSPFQVFQVLGGQLTNISSTEIATNAQVRILQININKDTHTLEILGTQIVTKPLGYNIYSPHLHFEAVGNLGPKNPAESLSPVNVIANVTDDFGKIKSSTLYYSVGCNPLLCREMDWHQIGMNLIWGNTSEGQYLGTIPPIEEGGTIVSFYIKVKDDLGYSTDTFASPKSFSTSSESVKPDFHWVRYFHLSDKSAFVLAWITDSGSGVKRAYFTYGNAQGKVKSLPMKLVDGSKWDGLYNVSVVPVSNLINNNGYVSSQDSNSSGNNTSGLVPVKRGDNLEYNTALAMHGKLSISVAPQPSIENLSAGTRYTVSGQYPVRDVQNMINSSIKVIPLDQVYSNDSNIPITITPPSVSKNLSIQNKMATFSRNYYDDFSNGPGSNESLKLQGERVRFPFDSYHLNFVLAIPFKKIDLDGIKGNFRSGDNATWDPSLNYSQIKDTSIRVQTNVSTPYQVNGYYVLPQASGINDPSSQMAPGNFTFEDVTLSFNRNSSILGIVIPLFAIFYLLGAIFILESGTDQLAIRVAITLGIFAFLFTLTPIMGPIKPTINTPTVADFMVTIIILATITFTISSIISNHPPVKRHKKVARWIDSLAFILIASITLFYGRIYPLDIIEWLIPIILIGLGYGLLLRISRAELSRLLTSRKTRQSRLSSVGSASPLRHCRDMKKRFEDQP